jgi:hypothetical protein
MIHSKLYLEKHRCLQLVYTTYLISRDMCIKKLGVQREEKQTPRMDKDTQL